MPTLTAPISARAAAAQRGLVAPAPAQKSPAPEPAEPSKKRIKAAAYRARQQSARDHLWPLLHEVFPEVFRVPAVPLAIGMHDQIIEVAGDSIDPAELSAFLSYWCRRNGYLRAVADAEPRHNLDGSIAGVPDIEQRNAAAALVYRGRWTLLKSA